MSENQSLKEKTAKGLFWGGFSNGIQQLLNLLFGIFLARLLTPSDYGMVGMLAIFSLIASSIQESGFTAALVNKKEVTHNDYNAVFWFNAAISRLQGINLPEAWNNLGVAYAMKKDYTTAMQYFDQAAQAGMQDAAANRDELAAWLAEQ